MRGEMSREVPIRLVALDRNEEENYAQVAFAEEEEGGGRYVILQRALELDSQDVELGMNGPYVEVFDRANSGYDLIHNAHLQDRALVLEFSKAEFPTLTLSLADAHYDDEALRVQLAFIFGDKFRPD